MGEQVPHQRSTNYDEAFSPRGTGNQTAKILRAEGGEGTVREDSKPQADRLDDDARPCRRPERSGPGSGGVTLPARPAARPPAGPAAGSAGPAAGSPAAVPAGPVPDAAVPVPGGRR